MSKKLLQINASAYQYYQSQLCNIKEIGKPLQLIGIPWFGYVKLFNNGQYIHYGNNENWIQCMYSSIPNIGKFFSNELVGLYKNPSRQLFLPNDIRLFNAKEDPIFHRVFDYNIWNFWHIWKVNKKGYLEAYYFAMTKHDEYAEDFYIKNNHLLHKFIEYFKEAASDIIEINDKSKLAHFDQSFDFHGKSDEHLFDEKVKKFLQEIKIDKRMIQGKYENVKLTKREIDCLEYLSLGYNMKGVASILGLSPRTIESYICNAKEKTGYNSKQLLLTKFIEEFKNFDKALI